MLPLEQAGVKAPAVTGDILRTPATLSTEQPASGEQERLGREFTGAINLVGTVNEKMVDWDYTGPDRDTARKTEPADIVQQDGKLKGLPTDHPDVIAESQRKKALIPTFDKIHTVVTCKQAAADEIAKTKETERQALIKAKKDAALAVLKVNDASVTDLPAADVKKIEDELQELPPEKAGQIESDISSKYYDEKTGKYKKYKKVQKNINGKKEEVWEPVMENGQQVEVDITDTYKPLVEELARISKLTPGASGNDATDEQIQQAQQLVKTFKLHPQNEKKLLMYTEKQIETRETNEQSENAANTGIQFLAAKINDADIIEKGADGKPSGLKKEALKKVQEDPRLARLVILTGHYYELQELERQGQPVSEQRHNIAALIRQELISIENPNEIPEGLRDQVNLLRDKSGLLKARFENMVKIIKEKWLQNENYNVDEANFTQDMIVAAYCEEMGIKPTVEQGTGRHILPENVRNLLSSPKQYDFVTHLIENGYVSNFFRENLGLSVKELNKNMPRYITDVVGKITKEIGDIGLGEWISKIINGLMSEENMKNLLKNFNLPPGAGMILMLGLVIMPLGQQVAEEGGGGDGGGEKR